jgi:hypothetical protein
MKQRWLVTIAACLSAMALSASAVVAAPAAKVDRGITSAGGCGHGTAATEVGGVKPAKNEQKSNRGRHLGQGKDHPTGAESDDSDSEEQGGDHERKQNHGWFVSQVARDDSITGRAHGEAVSEVARSDQGKPEQANP